MDAREVKRLRLVMAQGLYLRELPSLDASLPGGDGGDEVTLGALVADPDPGPSAFDLVLMRERQAQAWRLLASIPAREAAVLTLRYGLAGREWTQGQIAAFVGRTASWACWLEKRAITRLRALAEVA